MVQYLAKQHGYERTRDFFDELEDSIDEEVIDRLMEIGGPRDPRVQSRILSDVRHEVNQAMTRIFADSCRAMAGTVT
jgi:hypothetical protein